MPQVIRKFKYLTDLAGSSASLKQILLQKLNYHNEDVGRLEKALGDQHGIEKAYTKLVEADPKIVAADKKIAVLEGKLHALKSARELADNLGTKFEKQEKELVTMEKAYKTPEQKKVLQKDKIYKAMTSDLNKLRKSWNSAAKKVKDFPKINKQLQLLKGARTKLVSDAEKSLNLTLISDGTRFLLYIGKKLHITVPIKN